MNANHVIVRFGSAISSDWQGAALLHLEKWFREQGVPAECYKETMADDSKLWLAMTSELRKKL